MFVAVGGRIGALATVVLTVFTALAGLAALSAAMRWQMGAFSRLRDAVRSGAVVEASMLRGALVFAGGCLLLLPGFLTDTAGLLCLLPPTRSAVARWFLGRTADGRAEFVWWSSRASRRDSGREGPRDSERRRQPPPRTIEGSARRLDDE